MNFSDITPGSARQIAYLKAKNLPGISVKFQGEDGYQTVRYAKGTPAEKVFDEVLVEAKPGYWYEKSVRDVTKMTEDLAVGFRVYDIEESDDG